MSGKTLLLTALFGCAFVQSSLAQRQMERLDRGVVAVKQTNGAVFVGWRMLGTDPDAVGFNLYRTSGGSAAVKVNATEIMNATHLVDAAAPAGLPNAWSVRAVVDGREISEEGGSFRLQADAPARPYLSVPLQTPPGYTPNDGSVGDLDGDGQYDIVLHQAGRGRDNAQPGLTDPPILQGYKLDGTLLWTINLGRNIREGAHYTQFMVYDLDGDGRAEVVCKTADGTKDGLGKTIGDPAADWRDMNSTSRTFGKILKGPEYLTVFDGRTGAALATTNYVPSRGDLGGWGGRGGNGGNDSIGNRSDRFLACVAHLDGKRPSVVMCRGYYGRSVLAAWDWRDGKLTQRWVFDSTNAANAFSGQGAHAVSVADVDGDGRDDIVYHSMVVSADGKGLFSTDLRHGDALHVGDLDPEHPGLEVFGVHENEEATMKFGTPGTALYDARTGKILWSHGPGLDAGRGMSADIDPRHPGEEMWSGPAGLRTAKGESLARAPRSTNFGIWWDGDLLRELLDGTTIAKWDYEAGREVPLLNGADFDCVSNNGTKANPVLSADILGDWREEVVWRSRDGKELRIFTTTIPTEHRLRTLMHDPQYRLGVAWQNVGYNQPPHPGFFLGHGMKSPPKPVITTVPGR